MHLLASVAHTTHESITETSRRPIKQIMDRSMCHSHTTLTRPCHPLPLLPFRQSIHSIIHAPIKLSINGYIDPPTHTFIHAFTRSKFPASLHSLIHCFIASLFASSPQGLLPWNNARGRLSPQASCGSCRATLKVALMLHSPW